ncbi:MAG: hypothetical protein HOE90_13480 [Bacteriovoracaceae bacterium]|nr:hypothetical protein [Bacteriovoracaceae bacterium]
MKILTLTILSLSIFAMTGIQLALAIKAENSVILAHQGRVALVNICTNLK